MGVTIEVKVDNTRAVLDETQAHKERALIKCGAAWESYAKQGAPVDTGRLRNSITHELESPDTVAIGSDVKYAIYQEMGTTRNGKPAVPAKWFLKLAGVMHIEEYENIIANEFNNG